MAAELPHPTLAALLNGQPPAALRALWPRGHLAAHGPVARLAAPLQALLNLGHAGLFDLCQRRRGEFSFGRGAKTAHPVAGQGHPAAMFGMGLTVHLHAVDGWLPGADDWLRLLENELGAAPGCARLAAFASPQGDGLPWHFDGEDVISVQLVGRKRFAVAPLRELRFPVGEQFGPGMVPDDAHYAQFAAGFPQAPGGDAEIITLEPGSVLFLPRGHWHHTVAETDSLSASVVLRPLTALSAVLRQLQARLLGDEAWRTPLYGTAAEQAQLLSTLLPTLQQHVSALDPIASLPRPALPRLEDVHDATRWQAVPSAQLHIQPRVQPHDSRWQLTVFAIDSEGLERIALQRPVGAALVPALRWLAQHRAAFSTAELGAQAGGLPPADRDRLLIGLAQAGALRRL